MSIHTFYKITKARIQEEIQIHEEFVLNGECATHETYKHRIGIILGLKGSLETLQETLKNFEDEDFEYDDD